MNDRRTEGLLAWQWQHYAGNHHDRANLALHLATVPLFWLGCAAPLAAWLLTPWLALAALAAPLAMLAQGRGHRREAVAPAPFRGPVDVVTRILAEQWITFPRFVLSGALRRAWQSARRPEERASARAA